MKDKAIKFLKSKLLFVAVINITIMMLCILITSFSYENSNDFYNSLLICNRHFYYSNDINCIFAVIIGSIQFILPNFNCFVLAQILLSCTGFITISFVLADKFGKRKALFFSLLINILFALNHYSLISSTRTSALLLISGFLLIINAIRNKRYNLPFWIGLIEILFGTCLCFEYFYIGFIFAIAYFLGDMISKRKYKLPFRKFFWYFRPFVLVFLFVALIGFGAEYYSYSVNNSSDELKGYYTYSELSDDMDKYPYPSYSSYSEQFNNAGINNKDEYELLRKGYIDIDNSLDNTAIAEVVKAQKSEYKYNILSDLGDIGNEILTHITSFDSFAIIYIIIIILTVIYILLQKKRFAFFPIFYFIAALTSALLIKFFIFRLAYNMYGIWLMMCVLIIYSFDFEHLRKKESTLARCFKPLTYIIILIIVCTGYAAVYFTRLPSIDYNKKPSNLYAEINRHPERYYILDPTTADDIMKYTDNYTHPLWGFKARFMHNVDSFGYFHQNDQLNKRNLPTNIYKAVIDNKNVFVIDSGITNKKEKYFNKYYVDKDKYAVYDETKIINDYSIYRIKTQ